MATYDFDALTGIIIPNTGDILATDQQIWRDAFGQNLVVDPSTPEGAVITAQALLLSSVVRLNAAVANQINPNYAGGPFLDALMALTGSQREAAKRSTVTCTCAGLANTVIPAGSVVQDTDGDQWQSTAAAVIGMGGTVNVPFESVEFGLIGAIAGSITQIITPVLGWETVTNAGAATPGQLVQSDAATRLMRRQQLALQVAGIGEAVTSRVSAVPGFRSLAFRENVAATTQVIDGVSMVAHSIYVCVDGGTDSDVAAALLASKDGGCNWNGTTTVNVVNSGQTYAVKFQRPAAVNVYVRTTIRTAPGLTNPVQATKDAITAYAGGSIPGEVGFAVGEDVSPFELSGAINTQNPGIYVQSLEVSNDGVTWVTTPIPISIQQVAATNDGLISVTVLT